MRRIEMNAPWAPGLMGAAPWTPVPMMGQDVVTEAQQAASTAVATVKSAWQPCGAMGLGPELYGVPVIPAAAGLVLLAVVL